MKLETKEEKEEYQKVDIVKRMEQMGRDSKGHPKAWNIEENIRLLDFMASSRGENDWNKLLEFFGGRRNIEDIILQFLQFPISNI